MKCRTLVVFYFNTLLRRSTPSKLIFTSYERRWLTVAFTKSINKAKSELKPGDYITEFISAGPKNYGYRTAHGKTELKVKGHSLNAEGSEQLHYDLVRNNVIREVR